MLWFFIGGAIVVVLLVYASHESSRAAFFRAKAREIECRTQGQLVIDVPSSSGFVRGRNRHETLSRRFDERISSDVVMQHENEEEDLYDHHVRKGKISSSEASVFEDASMDPISRSSELKSIDLDMSAMSFLKQIGAKVPSPIHSESEEIIDMDKSNPEVFEQPRPNAGTSLVVQESIQVPSVTVDRVPFFREVSLLLYMKVKSGTYFISGQIIEKYADDFCRISDGTGTKFLSHERFSTLNLDDIVICQIEVRKSAWECLQVWKRDIDSIRNVI